MKNTIQNGYILFYCPHSDDFNAQSHKPKPKNSFELFFIKKNKQYKMSNPFSIQYLKVNNHNDLVKQWTYDPNNKTKSKTIPEPYEEWNPYEFEKIQLYNPIHEQFFEMDEAKSKRVMLNSHYVFHDLKSVIHISTQKIHSKPMFIKFCPLIDPLRYLTGKYKDSTLNSDFLTMLPTIDLANPDRMEEYLNSSELCIQPKPIREAIRKIHDPNNCAYVDSFFNFLSSKLLHAHNLQHGIDYYGSFLGIQKSYRLNIYDDINYLKRYTYFKHNMNKMYQIYDKSFLNYLSFIEKEDKGSSRRHRNRLCMEDDAATSAIDPDTMLLLGIEDLGADDAGYQPLSLATEVDLSDPDVFRESPNEFDTETQDDDEHESDEQIDTEKNSDDDENDDDESDDDESDDDESDDACPPVDDEENEILYAYIEKFPVQMVCMEKCENTLDSLFTSEELNEDNLDTEGASMMFQLVACLIAYQQAFQFTHNDLHTNNIVWNYTQSKYIFYKIGGNYYRVPTYGRIYKIIDFGRAIYHFQDKRYCSDSFSYPDGDASTQYNCEPYLIPEKPIIEPNPSFDLCRLACSIYDFIVPEEDDSEDWEDAEEESEEEDVEEERETDDDDDEKDQENDEREESEENGDDETQDQDEILEPIFTKLIKKWCQDDKGLSVLYKKNGKERYPFFKLYKMISRTVHHHIPKQEIHHELFQPFLLSNKDTTTTTLSEKAVLKMMKKEDFCIDIDSIPSYYLNK